MCRFGSHCSRQREAPIGEEAAGIQALREQTRPRIVAGRKAIPDNASQAIGHTWIEVIPFMTGVKVTALSGISRLEQTENRDPVVGKHFPEQAGFQADCGVGAQHPL